MAALIGPMDGFTVLQAGATAAENGANVDLTGGVRGLVLVEFTDPSLVDNATESRIYTDAAVSSTDEGVLTFETSKDDGATWATATIARRVAFADSLPEVATVTASEVPVLLKLTHQTGRTLFRARISTAFDFPITVSAVAVGRLASDANSPTPTTAY